MERKLSVMLMILLIYFFNADIKVAAHAILIEEYTKIYSYNFHHDAGEPGDSSPFTANKVSDALLNELFEGVRNGTYELLKCKKKDFRFLVKRKDKSINFPKEMQRTNVVMHCHEVRSDCTLMESIKSGGFWIQYVCPKIPGKIFVYVQGFGCLEEVEQSDFETPVKTQIASNVTQFAVGSNLTLPCVVEGDPKPEVTWLKDDCKLVNTDKIQISSNYALTITDVSTEDSGVYKCFAHNQYSAFNASLQIIVQGIASSSAIATAEANPSVYSSEMKTVYTLHKKAATWNTAREACKAEGASLLVIENQFEADFVQSFMKSNTIYFSFVGLHDLFKGGNYVTEKGVPVDAYYNEWGTNQPDKKRDNKSEHCIAFAQTDKLHDFPCDTEKRFICVNRPNECSSNPCNSRHLEPSFSVC